VSGHLATETGCGLNIGLWSIRSLLDSEIHRERGGEGMRIQNGLYSLPKFRADQIWRRETGRDSGVGSAEKNYVQSVRKSLIFVARECRAPNLHTQITSN
jgi:hypothetical protein